MVGPSGDALARPWLRSTAGLLAAAMLACIPALAQEATTTTITTSYVYNADGALTQVSKTVDGGAAEATYLTWDNFVPEAGNASTGIVSPGNGNLRGIGPSPGEDFASTYAFDRRNRLTRYAAGATSVAYAYHPTSTLASSTLASGDTLRFYYGGGGLPRIANIRQSSTDLTSGRLGPTRYLSDGRQQVLLQPRKDVAGVYLHGAEDSTFDAYDYDAYGGPTGAPGGDATAAPTTYDLADNPFRYAGEFQDPSWQGIYLRARWYAPELQTFVSRDPRRGLNRYGYTDGNPIGRVDPTGESWDTFANWTRRKIVRPLESGPLGWALTKEFLTAPVLGVAGILAQPTSWWAKPGHSIELGLFIAAGVAAEWYVAGWWLDGAFATDTIGVSSYRKAFLARRLTDVALGGTQSAISAAGPGHFSGKGFASGLAMTFGAVFWARDFEGIGYRPHNLTADDVVDMGNRITQLNNERQSDFLVFRAKEPLGEGWLGRKFNRASPVGWFTGTEVYHESSVIIWKSFEVYGTEEHIITMDNVGFERIRERFGIEGQTIGRQLHQLSGSGGKQFDFVGRFRWKASLTDQNFLDLPSEQAWRAMSISDKRWSIAKNVQPLLNNCHWYANRVVSWVRR